MEFEFKNNVKIVVNFEIGEKILIKGFGGKLNGEHIIEDIKTNFGGCESGILAKVLGRYVDIGWLTKL